MDNDHQLPSPFNDGYEQLKFDVMTEVILFSQCNRKIIIKEHAKMKDFYKAHPHIFLASLNDKKKQLEGLEELSEKEKIALKSINEITENHEDIDSYFAFQEDFLLDSYQKVYIQMAKLDRDLVKKSELVDIIFYSLSNENRTVPIGEKNSNGEINTGSKLQLEVLKVNPKSFIYLYQILLN